MRFALLLIAALAFAQTPPALPPVNEPALAARLAEMVKPSAGERAVLVYDPAYYPGITNRLRDELHRRGVHTYLIVEDSETMINSYRDQDDEHDRRRDDVIATLLPVFRKSDIFYWMPARGYVNDLRWERLVEQSNVRSVHFHWLLPFPGDRDSKTIASETERILRAALEVDLEDHARKQERVAAALRGKELRVTSAEGTDLRLYIPPDQWFHFGNHDASKARAEKARSVRDRQMEFPVGMFMFVPVSEFFTGTANQATVVNLGAVKDARFVFERGRVTRYSAADGVDAITRRMGITGRDGNLVASIFLPSLNPFFTGSTFGFDIGSNWENGGKNRAIGMRRVVVRIPSATLTVDGRVIFRDGQYQWDAIP